MILPTFSIVEWLTSFSIPAILGIFAWLWRLNTRVTIAETTVNRNAKDIDDTCDDVKEHSTRITRAEDGIIALKDGQLKLETKLDSINGKLDTLPRLEATINTINAAIQQVVPRSEIEARFRSVDDAIAKAKA